MADSFETLLTKLASAAPVTRRQLYDYGAIYQRIVELNRPVSVSEIAKIESMPYNYIRQWMERKKITHEKAKELCSREQLPDDLIAFVQVATGVYVPIQVLHAEFNSGSKTPAKSE